jgi:hypothetical protein
MAIGVKIRKPSDPLWNAGRFSAARGVLKSLQVFLIGDHEPRALPQHGSV